MNIHQVIARQIKGLQNMISCKTCKHYAPVEEKYLFSEFRKEVFGNRGYCQHINDIDAIRVYSDSEPVLVDGDWACISWEDNDGKK